MYCTLYFALHCTIAVHFVVEIIPLCRWLLHTLEHPGALAPWRTLGALTPWSSYTLKYPGALTPWITLLSIYDGALALPMRLCQGCEIQIVNIILKY